jgi:hypothetical protein
VTVFEMQKNKMYWCQRDVKMTSKEKRKAENLQIDSNFHAFIRSKTLVKYKNISKIQDAEIQFEINVKRYNRLDRTESLSI